MLSPAVLTSLSLRGAGVCHHIINIIITVVIIMIIILIFVVIVIPGYALVWPVNVPYLALVHHPGH